MALLFKDATNFYLQDTSLLEALTHVFFLVLGLRTLALARTQGAFLYTKGSVLHNSFCFIIKRCILIRLGLF